MIVDDSSLYFVPDRDGRDTGLRIAVGGSPARYVLLVWRGPGPPRQMSPRVELATSWLLLGPDYQQMMETLRDWLAVADGKAVAAELGISDDLIHRLRKALGIARGRGGARPRSGPKKKEGAIIV
jgi:hypothetical protein